MHAALVLVQIAFASQSVEAKLAMLPRAQGGEGMPPEAVAMVRMVGAATFFHAAVLFRRPASGGALGRSVHVRLVGLAILGVALNQALFLAGLRLSTPFSTALLSVTIPVFTAGLSIVFGKERPSLRVGAGILLSLSGVVWLTGVGSVSADRGAMLVALNSLSYSAYLVFSRETVRAHGSFRILAWVFTYGLVIFAPLGGGPLVEMLAPLSTRGWIFVAYLIVVPTILAYSLNAWALARSNATIVTIYIYVQPLIAAVLARVQLGYEVSSRALVASLFILAGVAITTRRAT